MQRLEPESYPWSDLECATHVRITCCDGRALDSSVYEYWPMLGAKDVLDLSGYQQGDDEVWFLPDARIARIEVLARSARPNHGGHPEVGFAVIPRLHGFVTCEKCEALSPTATSFHKNGHDDEAVALPDISRLKVVGGRWPLKNTGEWRVAKCADCGAYFRYEFSYEFLVNGSEDEESLTRLDLRQALQALDDWSVVLRHQTGAEPAWKRELERELHYLRECLPAMG